MNARLAPAVALGLLVAACGSDPSGPPATAVDIAAIAGTDQFGTVSATLADSLRVVVTNAATHAPVKDVRVTWAVVEGGGTVTPTSSTTDALGIASTTLRLGAEPGTYRVEASAEGLVGEPATFEAHAVGAPVIASIAPTIAAGGDTITITGTGFGESPAATAVLFDGLRGEIVSVGPTVITVTVPTCLPARAVQVVVMLGAVASEPAAFTASAGAADPLALDVGQAGFLAGAAQLGCLRFASGDPGAAYLVVPQNAASALSLPLRYELHGLVAGIPVTAAAVATPQRHSTFAAAWEMGLRRRERALFEGGIGPFLDRTQALAAAPPQVGDRRDFNVLNADMKTDHVTAEIVAISDRAIMYQDIEAPANGFSQADFAKFGQLFDDPIYATDVDIFGAPSDVDANDHVLILFTPRVNALTPKSDESFIAGFFYGCDLVAATRCAETNSAEIFYSVVPDPAGKFSGSRSKEIVLRTVPGVLAHEFQHMINFSEKNESLDDLWLSEALAHSAEDIVGSVFLDRGDTATAADFKLPNYARARAYLASIDQTSLIADDPPGSLEERGAGWLFLKYLVGHYGGNDLLGRLTRSTNRGIANITAETGQPWSDLLADFGIAVWADHAPELQGVQIDSLLAFSNFDVRRILGQFQGGFPLVPVTHGFEDFLMSAALPAASQTYVIVQAQATSPPDFSLALTGARGGPFGPGAPQILLLRIR